MRLDSHIALLLEAYEPKTLGPILEWLEPELNELSEEILRLHEQAPPVDAASLAASLAKHPPVPVAQLIEFSILNELGPRFGQKTGFRWLFRNVSQRLASKSQADC